MIEREAGGRVGGQTNRRERRVAVDLPASVGGRSCRAARALDVSLVGCLLRCEAGLDSGVVVDVQIDLPNGPLRTKARVAQSFVDGDSLPGPAHYLTGLEFLGLAAADVPRLRSFIEAESRRSAGAGQTSS